MLRGLPDVVKATVGCPGALFATDQLCADIEMNDGARLRFERIGLHAFGGNAVNVVVSRAGALVPLVASCGGIAAPNFQRNGPLSHHFNPPLFDVKDAVMRYQEVLEQIEFWPQCPQYYELQDHRGANYRYCARRLTAIDEPPKPANCQ